MQEYFHVTDCIGNCYYVKGKQGKDGTIFATHYRLNSFIFEGKRRKAKHSGINTGGLFSNYKIRKLKKAPF